MIFKKGDTFDFTGQVNVKLYDGQSIDDLTGWTGRSQIRDASQNLIADLTFTWIDAATRTCRLHTSASTTDWPTVDAYIDIEFTSPEGVIASTNTEDFCIVDGPTLPAE